MGILSAIGRIFKRERCSNCKHYTVIMDCKIHDVFKYPHEYCSRFEEQTGDEIGGF